MTPTEILKHEHRIILMVLDAAENEAKSILSSNKIDADKIEKMLDFFKNFADLCHHAKEGKHLFVMMQKRGMPAESGPIAVMLKEHDGGRKRLKAITDTLPQAIKDDSTAIMTIKDNLSGYVEIVKGSYL